MSEHEQTSLEEFYHSACVYVWQNIIGEIRSRDLIHRYKWELDQTKLVNEEKIYMSFRLSDLITSMVYIGEQGEKRKKQEVAAKIVGGAIKSFVDNFEAAIAKGGVTIMQEPLPIASEKGIMAFVCNSNEHPLKIAMRIGVVYNNEPSCEEVLLTLIYRR